MGLQESADDRRDKVGGEDADGEEPAEQLAPNERLPGKRAELHPTAPVSDLHRVVTQTPPDHERRDHGKACSSTHDEGLVEPGTEEDSGNEATDQAERE